MKIEFLFQSFEWNVSFSTRSNSELGLDFAIRWERNKVSRKRFLWTRRIVFFVEIREIFEIKYLPQKYTFRKINTWTCWFRFCQRCQKKIAQTPWILSERSKNFQILVQLRLYLFRFLSEVCTLNCSAGHTVYMFDIPVAKRWHSKNLVTLKVAVLWDIVSTPLVEIAYILHGFRKDDLMSQKKFNFAIW